MTDRRQVIIAGGGPVGVGLALQLERHGVSCAVVDRRVDLGKIPKGQNLTQRSFEHFWSWGLADSVRAAGVIPPDYPTGAVTVHGDLLGEHWLAPPYREVMNEYYFQENGRLPQYRLEAVLRRRLAEIESVDTYIGWNAVEVQTDQDGVSLAIEKDGERSVLHGDYLVGCDGGRSLVREHCGIERHGSDFGELMALVVFRSRQLHEALGRFPDQSTYRVMNSDLNGYWRFFGRVDLGEGFFFHAPVPRSAADSPDFDSKAVLYEAAGFRFECEIEYTGFWDLRVQIADRYQSGRVFIAGDAAHTHPPYGGFGLNNGLEDAVNLGWKLGAVLNGWGGQALVDSYTLERQPVFEDIAENVIAGTIAEEASFLAKHDPERDGEQFAKGFRKLLADTAARMREVDPHYEGSPVIAGPPGGVSGARGMHSFAARAGFHLSPQPLSCGRNVFEELGRSFTLLAFDADDAAVAQIASAAESLKVPLTVVRDTYDGPRTAYGARLILVRPDQYVAWVGDEAPRDASGVLETVTGRRRGPGSR
jgi:4-hydroxyisophthalate hydroxylase